LSYTANMLADNSKGYIGNSFTVLQFVDSSNNFAMAKVREGLAFHGNVFFAYVQTAGKGQRGKKWETEPGQNITMSIVMEPFLRPPKQFELSVCIACACVDFLKQYSGDCFIKWPNDLYWLTKKVGGILIENIIQDNEWKSAIVGIGMNINQTQFPEHLPNPVSLRQITGISFSSLDLARELCRNIETRYNQLRSSGFMDLLGNYNENLFKKNQVVRLKQGNKVFSTRVLGATSFGQLHTRDSVDRFFDFGEVEWMIQE
jgi:BirA family biotin operon repressor/biotin-[acetyl-CoA-carboxylase] ligase